MYKKTIKLKKPFLIAEIGINHNGSLKLAKKLIDLAKKYNFDCVKFQKRDPEICVPELQKKIMRDTPWGHMSYLDYKKKTELGQKDFDEINKYCKKLKIDWFASAWDLNSQFFLKQFNLKYNKIASAMIVYEDLLRMVAKEGKHTFISTGMTTYDDIQAAVDIFRKANCSFELMHTVSTYPMKDEDANLNMIKTLREKFNCNVGYSGHEVGLAVSYAAAALNITSLERHITIDRAMYGSDQAASIEPAGFKQLIGAIRKIEVAMGDGIKKTIEAEALVAKNLRQHIN